MYKEPCAESSEPDSIYDEVRKSLTVADIGAQTEEQEAARYKFYDSPLHSFDSSFAGTFPEKMHTISEYLEQFYKEKDGTLVGMELGGQGCNLFGPKGLEKYFGKTVAFSLTKDSEKNTLSIPKNHELIRADVFHKRKKEDYSGTEQPSYRTVERWVEQNGKVDIIFERMGLGKAGLTEKHFLQILKRWYELLSPEGTMFIELPSYLYYPLNPTAISKQSFDSLREFLEKNKRFFDYSIDPAQREGENDYIRLRKLPGAPDSLDGLIKQDERLD